MTQVLHVQKVSGVSGSEAHLLSLLPLLRERGWDARMLVLHEGEPGARELRRMPCRDGVPSRRGACASTSIRRRARSLLAAAPTDDPPHASRARRPARPAGRSARAGAGARSAPSTASTSSGRPSLAAAPTVRRRARAPADRDLARSRAYLAETEGFDADDSRRPLRDRGRARAAAAARAPRLARRRPADPDQGLRRPAARVRAARERACPT